MATVGDAPSRDYDAMGPLGRALLPVYLGRDFPLVAALAAYVDDSIEPGAFVLAGYIGRVPMWDADFTPAWSAALKAAPRQISEFKASDCRQRKGEFDGWTRDECNALTTSVVDVLTTCAPYNDFSGFGSAAFSAAPTPSQRRYAEEQLFSLCFTGILFDVIGRFSRSVDDPRDIQLVLDDKPGFSERALRAFRRVREHYSPKFDAVPLPIFRDSKDVLPLQAADLLAYEARKEARSRIDGQQRPVSRALQRLCDSRFHRVSTIQYGTVVKADERRRAGLEFKHLLNGATLFESETPWRSIGHWPHAH